MFYQREGPTTVAIELVLDLEHHALARLVPPVNRLVMPCGRVPSYSPKWGSEIPHVREERRPAAPLSNAEEA